MSDLLTNILVCDDGTILESRHVHDARYYVDEDGNDYMVDGGLEYVRRSLNGRGIALTLEDRHSLIREWFTWGTNGINGDQETRYIKLKDLSDAHIINLIDFTPVVKFNTLFKNELDYREEHGIVMPDGGY